MLATVLTQGHVAVLAIATVLVCVWWLVMRKMFD
jgi:hypothetical protein